MRERGDASCAAVRRVPKRAGIAMAIMGLAGVACGESAPASSTELRLTLELELIEPVGRPAVLAANATARLRARANRDGALELRSGRPGASQRNAIGMFQLAAAVDATLAVKASELPQGPVIIDGRFIAASGEIVESKGWEVEVRRAGGPCGSGCTECAAGERESCYNTGQGVGDRTVDRGDCHVGERRCGADGRWGACVGSVTPSPELCVEGRDADCDGLAGCTDSDCADRPECNGGNECRPVNCLDPVCDRHVCTIQGSASGRCIGGECVTAETSCENGSDDDYDGFTDCGDIAECDGVSCGTGQACADGTCKVLSETVCGDGVDDDQDGAPDCEDDDCTGTSCRSGGAWQCRGGLCVSAESDCFDGSDNDADGSTDCGDSDCQGHDCGVDRACKETRCVATRELSCGGGGDEDEDGLTDCSDVQDCEDVDCGTLRACVDGACAPKVEADCSNRRDDDGDGATDCEDSECDAQSCAYSARVDCSKEPCVCAYGDCFAQSEKNCWSRTYVDEDGDGNMNCKDEDCEYKYCSFSANPAGGSTSYYCFQGECNCPSTVPACRGP